MLKFCRNKLISIKKEDNDILSVHGVLDDHIYGLTLNVKISISKLEILSVNGKWNRWTTPECPRAELFLKEAAGYKIDEEITQKIKKNIGNKSCRHFANLLIDCCFSAKEAALLIKWEQTKKENPDLSIEEFFQQSLQDNSPSSQTTKDDIKIKKIEAKVEVKTSDKIETNACFDKDEIKGFIVDLHVHTSPLSPCSFASVDEMIIQAKKIGLDGICLTEHNHFWDEDEINNLRQKHGFNVLCGNEITTDQGDMLVFGFNKDIKGIISLEELKKQVEKSNGFIIAAHPFRGFLTFNVNDLGLTPGKAANRTLFKYVDALEVLNGKVTEKENDFTLQVAKILKLPISGGSDAHEVFEIGKYATCFSEPVTNNDELVTALRNGKFSPVIFK